MYGSASGRGNAPTPWSRPSGLLLHTNPLFQCIDDMLIAHLPSPHRNRLWGIQALCKGRAAGCAGVFLCQVDFSRSVTLPPILMAKGLPARIAAVLALPFLVRLMGSKTPQKREPGWYLCTSGFSLHQPPAVCLQDPHSSALTGQLLSLFKSLLIKPTLSCICSYFLRSYLHFVSQP